MGNLISIKRPTGELSGTIVLPGSKSESNRALIIHALSGGASQILNLSDSTDTQIIKQALCSTDTEINVQDAGAAMRFLTAYFAATAQDKIITGSPRMLERPIKPLVDALLLLGAKIEYRGKPGYPPARILGSQSVFNNSKVNVSANISSQFISALCMIAPVLPEGLQITLVGEISSRPYLEMTLVIMHHFGINSDWTGNIISIKPQIYSPVDYVVESDWSCASYWYAIAALTDDPAIFLSGLKRNSKQGDSIIRQWMQLFGVVSEFSDTGAFITKGNENLATLPEIMDFRDYPDLAQTMIMLCAVKKLRCKFTGLESLRIKETDRIQAMQNELSKFGIQLTEEPGDVFSLQGNFNKDASPFIETYSDHRMAMAFTIPAIRVKEIKMNNANCVRKSYPGFWDDLKKVGFRLQHKAQ